jgi:two-component system response regulator PilR (NtrC family)
MQAIEEEIYHLCILDMSLPDGEGLEILKTVKDAGLPTVVIVVTAFGSIESAVKAMHLGAWDYLPKPLDMDNLEMVIQRALKQAKLCIENIELHRRLQEILKSGEMICVSQKMRRVLEIVHRVAPTELSVLITGESGTGKELIAGEIHGKSGRGGRLVAINCASIPNELLEAELFGYKKGAFTGANSDRKGLIEEAQQGTLFLDEIGDMPFGLQAKMLRFLETGRFKRLGETKEREVQTRIVAATNQPIERLLQEGRFREDLYYRIKGIEVHLPPLRDRKEEIPLLVERFVSQFSSQYNKPMPMITTEFLNTLSRYQFPGNIRELKNIVERAVVLSHQETPLTQEVLPEEIFERSIPKSQDPALPLPPGGLDNLLDSHERKLIIKALGEAKGVKKRAAELLGISFRSLRYRLQKLEIEKT